MRFTIEDRHLIKCLQVGKVMQPAASLCKMFSNNGQTLNIDEMILLIYFLNCHDREYQAIWLMVGKWSSMQWRSAHTPANINKVENLALSYGDKPQKQFTIKNCMTD